MRERKALLAILAHPCIGPEFPAEVALRKGFFERLTAPGRAAKSVASWLAPPAGVGKPAPTIIAG